MEVPSLIIQYQNKFKARFNIIHVDIYILLFLSRPLVTWTDQLSQRKLERAEKCSKSLELEQVEPKRALERRPGLVRTRLTSDNIISGHFCSWTQLWTVSTSVYENNFFFERAS